MRLEEWQTWLDSQFLDEPAEADSPVQRTSSLVDDRQISQNATAAVFEVSAEEQPPQLLATGFPEQSAAAASVDTVRDVAVAHPTNTDGAPVNTAVAIEQTAGPS